MDTEKKDQMKTNGTWKAVREAFSAKVAESLEKHLQMSLDAFRQDMQEHPYIRRLERHTFTLRRKLILFFRPWVRPLLIAGTGLAFVFIAVLFILGNNPPIWAQMQERFGSMPFFSLSIYKREVTVAGHGLNPLAEPELFEVWAGYGNRIRIRSGSKVTFVYKGEILNTFDLTTRSESYADSNTYEILNAVGKSNINAFDWLLIPFTPDLAPESISKAWKDGGLVNTTSLVMSNPMARRDLDVFDHEFYYFKARTGKARVWVLRESRLPVRIVIWPRDDFNGQLVPSPEWDMIISYSNEQPKKFFDPQAFAAKLKDPAISIQRLLYMFHQYPGGDSLPIDK